MNSLSRSFLEGGPLMYPLALLGCLLPALAIGLTVVALVSKTNRALVFGVALLLGAIIPAALGVTAESLSMRSAEEAILNVNPEDRATIRAAAMSESMTATLWGFGAAVFPTFFGFTLVGLGISKLDRFKR